MDSLSLGIASVWQGQATREGSDQAITATFARRYPAKPRPAKPRSIIAQVESSGTVVGQGVNGPVVPPPRLRVPIAPRTHRMSSVNCSVRATAWSVETCGRIMSHVRGLTPLRRDAPSRDLSSRLDLRDAMRNDLSSQNPAVTLLATNAPTTRRVRTQHRNL